MATHVRSTNEHFGHNATSPTRVPARGWLEITKRVGHDLKYDHVQVVAAGVAFYFFLALFPALAALVSIYGLLVEPAQVEQQMNQLTSLLPAQASELLTDIFSQIAQKSSQALGLGLVISIVLSLWSSKKAVAALFEGLNIAYHEIDRRSFLKKNALQLLFTLGAVVVLIVSMALIAMVPALLGNLGLPGWIQTLVNIARWPVLAVLIVGALALIYKKGPDRDEPRGRWVSHGALIAMVLWLGVSALFSLYVNNFGNFDKTYGSFAAIIVLMLWLFLTAFVIILGAEINSETEHQTEVDTTEGEEQPMGERGAYYADRVAKKE